MREVIQTGTPVTPTATSRLLVPRLGGWADLRAGGVERALAFDDGQDVGRAMRTFRGVYLGGAAAPSDVLIVGASFEEGYGTTLMTNGWTAVFRDVLRGFAQPKGVAGGGSTPASNANYQAGVGNYFGYNPFNMAPSGNYPDSPIIAAVANSGAFNPITTFGLGLRGLQCTNTSSFTIEFFGTGCDLVYSTDPTWGTFTWAVDGGGTTSQATTAATGNGARVQIRSLARGRHTVQCITTANGSSGLGVAHEGAVFYDGDEANGIRVWQAAKAGAKAQDFASNTNWLNSVQTWNVPDLVVINLGYNDIFATTGARTAAQVKTDLQTIITAVKSRATALSAATPSFVVMSSFNVTATGSSPVDTWDNAVRAMYEIAAADDDVCVFDYQHWFGKNTETTATTRGGILISDGLHPTDGGAAIIGGALAEFVLDSAERMRDLVRYGQSVKGSALPAVTTPAGTDKLFVVQGGVTMAETLAQIKAYADPPSASSSAAQTAFTSDTYLAGSSPPAFVPARLQAGTFYHCMFDVSKTAAGVAAAVVTLRIGTAGTTADTAICTFTFPSIQTAAVDLGTIEILANFRSVGSGTSAVVAGTLILARTNTTTGFLSTAALAMTLMKVTSAGFDSTAKTRIGLSINAGAAAAWTITTVQSELRNLIA